MDRPNILLVMADQMTTFALEAFRPRTGPACAHPAAGTPTLDSLARSGVVFRNAYCNSPLCVPARASLMTGKLPRNTGVFDNGSELPALTPTLAHHLALAGYRTILAGKMHFVGPDQHHGFEERLTGDISLAGPTLTPDWRRGAHPNPGSSVERLLEPEIVDWNLQLAYDEEVLSSALARLRKLRREEGPFFLCASFSHPHDPFRVTRELWDRYEGVPIPPPTAPGRPLEEMHPYDRWIQIHHEVDRFPLDEARAASARRAYWAMTSYVDDILGRLLGELERLGMADDTLVVFTSDHGEMLGEHGMWFKRTYFDAAAKVPLLFRLPGGLEPAVREEVVSLVDLAATLLDVARAPESEAWTREMDGDSLRGLLDGTGGAWKDAAVGEYYAEGSVAPMMYLRKGRLKYVFVEGQPPRLFDLDADPFETRDLAAEPGRGSVIEELEHELLGGLDPAELHRRILRGQRERLLVAAVMADHHAWDYRPSRDALELYYRAKR